MNQPAEVKYRNAFLRERPQHDPCDDFAVRHPKMDLLQRAKIFSPFDALKGFGEEIAGKREMYVEKRDLTEDEVTEINRALSAILNTGECSGAAHAKNVTATAVYYAPCADVNHEDYGLRGRYETVTGTVWKVDLLTETLRIGETAVSFADLSALRIHTYEG